MSEPKRYDWKVNEENDFDLMEHPNGEFVRYEDYARLKAEVERLQSIHSIDSIGIEQLKAEVERLTAFTTRTIIPNEELQAQVERLTKAVMHSPAAQLKLKELEGKTTFEEINPDNL